MAYKIEIKDNAVQVLDTLDSDKVLIFQPSKDTWYEEDRLGRGFIKLYGTTSTNEDNIKRYLPHGLYERFDGFAIADCVDTDDVVFTAATFRDFSSLNLGKSSGGSASIPTSEIFHGGFVDYNDSGTPIIVTAAGSPVVITNDGLGSFTNKTYLPTGVTDIWDSSTNRFDWTQLKAGDMVDIRLDLDLITESVNTEISVDLILAEGEAGEYPVPFITEANFKEARTHKTNRFNGIYMGDTNTLDNPAVFKISTDKDCSVVVNGWYCKIIRRG
ncbi:hypothetical protein N9928_01825 [bacterium]|nr:hypothetical protein [bacterium]